MQFYYLSHYSYSKGLQKEIVTVLTWVPLLFVVQQMHYSDTKQVVTWGNIEQTSALIISYLALIPSHPFFHLQTICQGQTSAISCIELKRRARHTTPDQFPEERGRVPANTPLSYVAPLIMRRH